MFSTNPNVFSMLAPLAYQTRSTRLSDTKTQRSRSDDASVTGAGTTMLTRYASKFPFYSVYAQGIGDDNQTGVERWKIEFAIAGYTAEETSVELSGDGVLTVKGSPVNQSNEEDEWITITHGIAKRTFSSQFQLPKNAEVDSVNLRDGILSINISVHRPQAPKSKMIPISTD